MTSTPHDAVFKAVFGRPKHAAAQLQHILPAEIVAELDWSSLALESGSFVDEDLADQHSDLLFSAKSRVESQQVLVYLLFEHQSTHEHLMALRLLRYMVRIWTRYSRANPNAALPPIIPAVLAQVPGGWRAPTRFSDLFSTSDTSTFAKVLPDFEYAVDDLANATNEDLRRRALAEQACLALWLMRDIRDAAALLEHLIEWAHALESLARSPGGERELGLLMRYVAVASDDLQLSQFRAILSQRAPTAESVTMTIAEQLRAEGHAQGQAEGHAQGQAQGQANALLVILEARGLHLPEDMKQRIAACRDPATLDMWLARAATADSLDEIFRP